MLDLKIHTNNNSGASNETWFHLRGQSLIDYFKDKMIPEGVEKIKKYL
jgi:hypothetical protein